MRALKVCRGHGGRFPLILNLGLTVSNYTAAYVDEVVDLRLIYICRAVPMQRPCRSHAVLLPRCAAKGLDCLLHLIYKVRPRLIHTCHTAPVPCHDHAVLKATSQGHGRAQHGRGMSVAWLGMCELASAVLRRHVGDLPAYGFFRLPRGVTRILLSEAYQSVKI
jgi:hypothetical protein